MPATGLSCELRAQGSISTLILLIAGLLIASITAGVLFDIVGGFQTTADSAADQSAEQLSARVIVLGAGGDVEDNRIREINLTLAREGGSSIDLSGVVISGTLGDGGSGAIDESGYLTLTTAVDDDGSLENSVLNDDGDRATLTVDLVGLFDTTLSPGDNETVRLLAPAGSSTTVRLTVPSPLPDGGSVAL